MVDRRGRRVRRLTLVVDPALRLGEDPFFMAVIEALQQAAQDDGQVVTLSRVPGDAPAGDGLIALGRAAAPMWRAWSSPRIAWLVDGAQAGMRASVIELDDEPGGRAAAVRLVDAGCRSIVFTGSTRLPSPRARWRGAAAVAAAAGLTFTTIESAMNLAAGLTLVDRLPRGRLGVIAANDWLAAGVRSGLLAAGRPEVPVIGFDGLAIAASLGVASLAVPIAAIAADAVDEVQRLARSPAAAGRRLVYPVTWSDGTAA